MRSRGTVYKRGKTFVVQIDRGRNPRTGKRDRDTYSGFATRDVAEREKTRLLHDLDTGTYTDPSALTVAHYLLDDWLPSRKPKSRTAARGYRGQLGIGTWASYRTDIEAYVVPRIGHVRLQKLTADDLDALYDDLEESGGQRQQGLSPKTVANIHGVIHKALADAVKRGKIGVNVADIVDAPRSSRTRPQVWEANQLRCFLRHVSEDRIYAAWLLWSTTGMRRGEVAGLAHDDLDLDAATVRVTWTLGVVDSKPTWKRRPKSEASERVMALDPATVDALRTHLARQDEEREFAGPAWRRRQTDWRGNHRDDLVFTWADGSLIHPERFSKWFARHSSAARLPHIRLHDVRHTYATVGLANAAGWHEVKVISQRLGHASVGFTIDTYAHVLPAADADTANTLARLILEPPA
jgi:integrase